MLTTAGYLGGIVRSLYYQKATATEAQAQTAEAKHQTELYEKWFGEKPTPPNTMREKLESKANYSTEERVQMAKDRAAQFQHQTSGQAGQDIEDMAAYEEQAREKAIINYTRDSRIEAKENHKKLAQRKEYLKKPRKLNRHGVLYEEVMK